MPEPIQFKLALDKEGKLVVSTFTDNRVIITEATTPTFYRENTRITPQTYVIEYKGVLVPVRLEKPKIMFIVYIGQKNIGMTSDEHVWELFHDIPPKITRAINIIQDKASRLKPPQLMRFIEKEFHVVCELI